MRREQAHNVANAPWFSPVLTCEFAAQKMRELRCELRALWMLTLTLQQHLEDAQIMRRLAGINMSLQIIT
jgi:hypothetical protein